MIRHTEPDYDVFDRGPDLAPLIDIVFIVIVFLLLTANVQLLPLPVSLPDTDEQSESNVVVDNAITITLTRSAPHWALGDETFSDFGAFKQALTHRLADQNDAQVIIASDKDLEADKLLKLFVVLQKLQLTNTQIIMEPEH